MSLEPLGNRVIIKASEAKLNEFGEEVSDSGLITKTNKEVRSEKSLTSEGIIIGYGPSAWLDPALGGEPWVSIGDKVLFAKYSGKFITDPEDDVEYVVVNDDAIQVRIVE